MRNDEDGAAGSVANRKPKAAKNRVRELREGMLMSKAELARRAGVSPLTIDRIERGLSCRLETKRKIILALGFDLSEKDQVFPGLTEADE